MSVHLLKPALRIESVYEFAQRQKARWMEHGGRTVYPVWTSRKPTRESELLDGGSVFWIVKNQIQCRQAALEIIPYEAAEGEKPSYLILCETQLMRVAPIARKPFQGWRYLEAENVPADSGVISINDEAPPPEIEKILRQAGLL